jgi:hypothetical protein
MTQESYRHPITPPPELVQEWIREKDGLELVVARAAQWGADQELEACCEWLASKVMSERKYPELRADRRPKPPSLKEQASSSFEQIVRCYGVYTDFEADVETIRRALEALDD